MNESIIEFSVTTDLTTYVNNARSQTSNRTTRLNAPGYLTSQLAKYELYWCNFGTIGRAIG